MQKLRAIWSNVTDHLWFLPTLFTLGSALLAVLIVEFDSALADLTGLDPADFWWLFGGGAEAGRVILDVIAGSIITVTGVTFSVTLIALQLTSSQFTPRVLRTFTADRGNQMVLGVFIATFTYTLLVQRAIRESGDDAEAVVPAFAITLAILMALASVGFLIYFIAHTTRSIQVNVIIHNVVRDTRRVIDAMFDRDRQAHPPRSRGAAPERLRQGQPFRIGQEAAGYVQAVDEDRLLKLADREDLYLEVVAGIGGFVLPGQPLLEVWPADRVDEALADSLRGAWYIGMERTPHQDLELGLIELVDIGVKAMSPSVNDPTTTITILDRATELLARFAREPALRCERLNASGRLCLVVKRPDFDRLVQLTYDQIRHHSAGDPAVMSVLLDRLGGLGELARDEHRPRLLEAIDVAVRQAEREIAEPADRSRVARAGTEASERIGRARRAGEDD